jgi:hypothetical protein
MIVPEELRHRKPRVRVGGDRFRYFCHGGGGGGWWQATGKGGERHTDWLRVVSHGCSTQRHGDAEELRRLRIPNTQEPELGHILLATEEVTNHHSPDAASAANSVSEVPLRLRVSALNPMNANTPASRSLQILPTLQTTPKPLTAASSPAAPAIPGWPHRTHTACTR